MRRRLALVALSILLSVTALAPVEAVPKTVDVEVDLAGTGPTGHLDDPAASAGVKTVAVRCMVAVPEGANGFAVMNAAVKKGCIGSYKSGQPLGWNLTSVTCVDNLCERALGFFAPFVGVTLTWHIPQSLHTYKAREGGRLAFAFGPGCTC